jgi:hypothetical protein
VSNSGLEFIVFLYGFVETEDKDSGGKEEKRKQDTVEQYNGIGISDKIAQSNIEYKYQTA